MLSHSHTPSLSLSLCLVEQWLVLVLIVCVLATKIVNYYNAHKAAADPRLSLPLSFSHPTQCMHKHVAYLCGRQVLAELCFGFGADLISATSTRSHRCLASLSLLSLSLIPSLSVSLISVRPSFLLFFKCLKRMPNRNSMMLSLSCVAISLAHTAQLRC